MEIANIQNRLKLLLYTILFSCNTPSNNKLSSETSTEPYPLPENITIDSLQIAIDTIYISADSSIQRRDIPAGVILDLNAVKERDTLKAITIYSSTSYFLYKGETMGYEYELARRLADYLDVELEMVVADNIDEIFDVLNSGKGDIIAYNLTITSNRQEIVDFTLPLNFTHQVLVQRKPDNWRRMKIHNIEKSLIRNPIMLLNKEIHIRENSSYKDRLENLEEELGGNISIQYLPGQLTTEEIMEMVHKKEINYTVADYNLASINASYYENLDIQTTVGVMQRLAWAVRSTSPDLLKATNQWIQKERGLTDFNVIYNKYFKNKRAFATRIKSDFYSKEGNKISRYDDLIKKEAAKIGWDWRLLASQVYQESGFDATLTSWAGAVGLMQLMPKTAKSYGYFKLKRPKSSIEAGVKHLKYLNNFWEQRGLRDLDERLKFILASYNAGQYHVLDATKLSKKYGMAEDIWYENVEKAIIMKSKEKYFNDPLVEYGYCRGEEPVKYVSEILERYAYYKQFIKEN